MHLIVLSGPTASGKTKLAIELAQHYKTVIVSADSRQFFREMSIGTAKPDREELEAAPHHFINSHSINTNYSVGQYEAEALKLLQQLFKQHEVVILTGGSGLYLKAVCEGLDNFPEIPIEVQQQLEAEFQQHGLAYLQGALQKADPAYFNEVDIQNPHRLIRALAVFRVSGCPFSSFRRNASARRPFHPIYIQLHWKREKLYQRINQRVDLMIQAGLIEETRNLFELKHLTALQTVGYQELFDHFEGKTSLEDAVNLIKRNSRRYAKRQLTWFRRDGFWKLFQPNEFDLARSYIDLSIQQGLELNQDFSKDAVSGQLSNSEGPIAAFERTSKNSQSISTVAQAPEPPLSWVLWHQLRMLALEDEEAYLMSAVNPEVPYWQYYSKQELPPWANRYLEREGIRPDLLAFKKSVTDQQ